MIKVGMYVHWAGVGGAEDMVIDEIRYADRQLIDYQFFTEEESGDNTCLDELRQMGVPVHRLPQNKVGEFKQALSQLAIVHVKSCGDVQTGYHAVLELGKPVVDTVACVAYSAGYERRSDLVQPVYLSHKHWEHGSGGKSQFKIIVGGVDLERLKGGHDCKASWGLDPKRLVVGWFGRFDQFKCPLSFVSIASMVKKVEPDCQFVMFGDGYDKGKTVFSAKQAGVDIKFVGYTRDKGRAFSAMDVYCFPTWQEAFGRVMPEAMACGVPIVTADYPVCKELCGDAALYVENIREDPLPRYVCQKYADMVLSLLLQPDRRYLMGSEGVRRAIESYDARRMSQEYGQLYQSLVGHA